MPEPTLMSAAELDQAVANTLAGHTKDYPWCPHPDCHDRAHLDGTHTDEHGHPFRNRPEETP